MATVAKCTNCQQFNREAEEEGDSICSRCKNTISVFGVGAQLPDGAAARNVKVKVKEEEEENGETL